MHVAVGDDFRKLQATYRAYDRSKCWLSKNRNSADGSDVSRHEQLVESNQSNRMQWQNLLRLDKKVRDKSKKDAPARLFLVLIELFSEFEREPMTYEEFEESIEGDYFSNYLLQTLEDKECHYEESM